MSMGTDFKNRLKDGRTENMGVQCEGCDDVFDVEHIDERGLCEACSLEEAYLPEDPRAEYTFTRDQAL